MRGVALLLAVAGAGFPYVVGYHVEPVKAQWSGWTGRGDTAAQSVTCNFDSLRYAELFAGAKGRGGAYRAGVWVDGAEVMWSYGDRVPDHAWVKFDDWNTQVAFTKGKKLTVKFTRGGNDSFQYCYQRGNPYPYGLLIDPNPEDPAPLTWDLAMRVYGRMNAVDSTDFGVCLPAFPQWDSAGQETWGARLAESGTGWATVSFDWDMIEAQSGQYDFELPRLTVDHMEAGIEPVGLIVNCPTWASTAMEWYWDTTGEDSWRRRKSVHCPPINLKPSGGETNYFARWVHTLVDSFGDRIHTWLIWNEPNDTCADSIRNITGWWRRPDTGYILGQGVLPLCSLYVRLCWVADSVIETVAAERAFDSQLVFIGNMHRVYHDPGWLVKGVDWLDMCYEVADNVFWDGIAFHAYQDSSWFDPDTFAEEVDTLRAVMRNSGHYGELWNTEAGWQKDTLDTLESRERAARDLCEMLVSTEASDASPGGGCARSSWWFFWENNPAWGHEPLLTDSFNRLPAFYAFRQADTTLVGKRFNRRVTTGDTKDDSIRMYEFEDTATLERTLVCWTNGAAKKRVSVKVPVRTNHLAAESLAYTKTPPAFTSRVANDGWLYMNLSSRPVFISERGSPLRPDLRVDSVRFARGRGVVRAWVTNHGSRATPVRSGSRIPYVTLAVLRVNGDSLARVVRTNSMAADQQAEFTFNLDQSRLPDTALLSITVNPSQTYVELGTDDNTGYVLAVSP